MDNIKPDLKPIEYAFSKISEGYAYCKIVTDKKGEPIDWIYIEVNDAYEQINGVKKADVVGKKATEVLPSIRTDPGDWIRIYGQVALTGQPIVTERYAAVRKKWYHVSAYCPQNGYFAAVFEDITERKKAEESIKQSEALFSKAFNESPVATIITRLADGCYIDVNDNFEQVFGYFKKEVIGRTSSELNIFADAGGRKAFLDSLQKKGRLHNVEMTFRSKTDRLVPCIISTEKININECEHLLTTLLDISDRKQAEQALWESEQRWSTTLSSIGDAVIATDTLGKVTFLNPVAEQLTGWTLALAKGKPIKKVFNIVNEKTRNEVENPVTKVLKLGLIVGLANHTVLIRKDGSEVPIDDSGAPIVGEEGKITGVVLVFRDITERKKADEALLTSSRRTHEIIESIQEYFYSLDRNWNFIYVNEKAANLLGHKVTELIGKNIWTVFPRALGTTFEANYRLAMDKREVRRFETRGAHADVWLMVTVFPSEEGISSLAIDITERKKAEEALKRQSALIDLSPNAIIVRKIDGTITFWSKGAEKLYGWTEEEALGRQTHTLFNTRFMEPFASINAKLLTGKRWSGELIHRTKDGHEVTVQSWWLAEATENGEITSILESNVDITEQKKAAQAILDSEERLKRSQAIAHLGSWELDLKQDKLTWSDEVYKIFGLKPQQFKATYGAFLSHVHPADRKAVDAAYSGSVREGKEGYEIEHRIVRKGTGEIRFVHEKCTHLRGRSGDIIKSVGMVHDITERKKAEEEISRLASFPTLNPAPVIEVEQNGKVTYANPATKQLFPTLTAQGIEHVFFSDWEAVKKAFYSKSGNTFGREIKINDHWYHQQFYLVPGTQQIRVYATDIDELKQAEEARANVQIKLEENAVMLEEYASQMEALAEQRLHQLKNAERLAAIGQTAGMVGHDIRNPLQAITSDMYLINEEIADLPEGDGKQAILESIESVNRNLVYINKIVSDLQDYTRPLKPVLQTANLSELVEGTLATIIIPKGVEVITDIKETAKPLKTDPAFIRRMLTNLVTNAIQAMDEVGKLTIKASKHQDTVVLAIEDTGVGIPEEVKAKMFTPLFTTKSKGQGLGLAVVKRIAEALGGSITFESDEGKGTKFIVELPQKP